MKKLLPVNERARQMDEDAYFTRYLLGKYLHTGNEGFLEQILKWERQREKQESILEIKRMMLLEVRGNLFGNYSIEIVKGLQQYLNCKIDFIETSASRLLLMFYHEYLENYERIANAICEFITKQYGTVCYIAVGRQIADISQSFLIYKKMNSILERKFYYTESKIFYMDKVEETRDKSQLLPEYKNRLKEDIHLKKFESLREDYQRVREYLTDERRCSYIYMKFICAEMVGKMYEEMNLAGSPEIQNIIEEIYWIDNVKSLSDLMEKNIRVYEKFNEQTQNFQMEEGTHDEVEWVKKYIQSHLDADLSTDVLAANIYLSPGYLSCIFKKETGTNLSVYIKEQRMEKAKELLRESNLKINQICEAVGFSQVAYFCQSFRKHYGVSPGKYRKGELE